MSPFAVVVVLLLSLLFVLLGLVNVAFNQADVDSFETPSQAKTKTA